MTMGMFRYLLTLCLLSSAKIIAYEQEISVCAIFRDEASILKEWIEFHKLIGVEHFYLYNNNSVDGFREILAPYIKNEIVSLIEWPLSYSTREEWRYVQGAAYRNCAQRSLGKTKWLAYIDVDEFIVPVKEYSLKHLLRKYHEHDGLKVCWVLFGTSHLKTLNTQKLLIEQLLLRAPLGLARNKLVKSIVKPESLDINEPDWGPHTPIFKKGYYAVDENKKYVGRGSVEQHTSKYIRINHYWMRSQSYFLRRKRNSTNRLGMLSKRSLDSYKMYNAEEDTLILRYKKQLRKAMGR